MSWLTKDHRFTISGRTQHAVMLVSSLLAISAAGMLLADALQKKHPTWMQVGYAGGILLLIVLHWYEHFPSAILGVLGANLRARRRGLLIERLERRRQIPYEQIQSLRIRPKGSLPVRMEIRSAGQTFTFTVANARPWQSLRALRGRLRAAGLASRYDAREMHRALASVAMIREPLGTTAFLIAAPIFIALALAAVLCLFLPWPWTELSPMEMVLPVAAALIFAPGQPLLIMLLTRANRRMRLAHVDPDTARVRRASRQELRSAYLPVAAGWLAATALFLVAAFLFLRARWQPAADTIADLQAHGADVLLIPPVYLNDLGNPHQNLRSVSLSASPDHLPRLRNLGGLQELIIYKTAISDDQLRDLLGDLEWLNLLRLKDTTLTGRGLDGLTNPSSLQYLEVRRGEIQDDGTSAIARMTHLRWLSLGQTRISSAALVHLRPLGELESLGLFNTAIDDEGLEHLAQLHQLRMLTLDDTAVRGRGLAALGATRAQLTSLHLSGCPLGNEDLAALAPATMLQVLELSRTSISDAGLQHLAAMQNLIRLDLSRTGCAGPGLADLAKLTKLSNLNLADTPVDDASAVILSNLAVLSLDLSGCPINDAALTHLARMPRLTSLTLDRTAITDAGMKALESSTTLKYVSVAETAVSVEAADHWRKYEEIWGGWGQRSPTASPQETAQTKPAGEPAPR